MADPIVIESDVPAYRAIGPQYLDDNYIDEGQIFYFDGPCNDKMEPMNKPARERMGQFIASLPTGGNLPIEDIVAASMSLRPREGEAPMAFADFMGAVMREAALRKFGNSAPPVHHSVELQKHRDDIPLMGNMNPEDSPTRRKPGRPSKVRIVDLPPGTQAQTPKRILGTIVPEAAGQTEHFNPGANLLRADD